MIQKLVDTAPIEWTHSKAMPSSCECSRCGAKLYTYTGEPVKEWDSQRGVYNTHQTGETLPCNRCASDMEDMATELAKLSYMQGRTARPKREGEPEPAYKNRVERDGRVEEEQRKHFFAMCAAFQTTMAQVADYVDASRRPQYGRV